MDGVLTTKAAQLAAQLKARGQWLAVAESCTGGWLAQTCTDLAGSSTWFERGFVTYSNTAKQEMLGVAADTLAVHGAVSAEVVGEMALGVLAHSHADHAVAISGIAGPSGGSVDKPVGTVWFAWVGPDRTVNTRRVRLFGDREAVRRQAVLIALDGLIDALDHA